MGNNKKKDLWDLWGGASASVASPLPTGLIEYWSDYL